MPSSNMCFKATKVAHTLNNCFHLKIVYIVTYIFSHDPKGPEELSFGLKRKRSSIRHFSDPWRQKES